MHNVVKALIAAGAIALSLAAGSAEAQSIGWNVIRPTSCEYWMAVNNNGQYVYTLYVYTSTFTVTVFDPVSVGAAVQWCYNSSAFWGYYNGGGWAMFYITPGMK